jgi:Domain of unknown function (DUF4845)
VKQRTLRSIAGVLVLVILAAIGIVLVPPYIENWKLQHYVNELVEDPGTAALQPDAVRAKIVSRASSLGLPVHNSDVQITRVQDAIRINVLYLVHVDVAGYAVDLHFRPSAGGT